ncbi:MAG TPA: LacI family DNA-binding transcriptional regulator [Microbacterium sp.]|uniref:LacI family DNA-binding transcriptional regulator n=1 Tax=Microbacterium sp. TaxID=51671 RepID=UPI002B49DFE4|nr:LacI family DNA-binding transcriptional regulator [Microbacterium sp.]HKT55645.1 LacI family DNA-binding transcriptional regulator [Microbacterium sp.]
MATIQDVAAAAGVSTASVSRHLAGQPVRTADAIARAIDELGYQPNISARNLRTGRHAAIGVIVPDVTNPFFAALIKGVQQEARAAGVQILLGNSDEDPAQENALIGELSQRTDGIIIAPLVEEGRSATDVARLRMPVVFVDRESRERREVDRVMVDNLGGTRLAVEHLAALGHTRIAFIGGPLTSTPGRQRHAGFLDTMREHDLMVDERLVVIADFRESGGHDAMHALWREQSRPTAVFAANNVMTLGALRALDEVGARVPDDISVVGFDDLSFATLLRPPLTVVRRPEVEQGAAAARLLLDRVDGDTGSPPVSVTLAVELVVRGSTGVARPDDGIDRG